ncbi:unnamed protein product, partial [Urochloa humidicola]
VVRFDPFENQVQLKSGVRFGPARNENWSGTAFSPPIPAGIHPHLDPSGSVSPEPSRTRGCEARRGGAREAELAAREARGDGLAARLHHDGGRDSLSFDVHALRRLLAGYQGMRFGGGG